MWPPPRCLDHFAMPSFASQNLTKTQPAWLLSVQPWIGNPPVPPKQGNQRVINETSNEISVEFWDAASTTWPQESCCCALLNCVWRRGTPKKYEAYLVTSGVFKGVWADFGFEFLPFWFVTELQCVFVLYKLYSFLNSLQVYKRTNSTAEKTSARDDHPWESKLLLFWHRHGGVGRDTCDQHRKSTQTNLWQNHFLKLRLFVQITKVKDISVSNLLTCFQI